MIPVLTSFLPPTHTHLYLPTIFSLWEAFNSTVMDDRLLDLAGSLSEEHVAGTHGQAGDEGGAQRKDIGIWTELQWDLLVGKGLQSMSNTPYVLLLHRLTFITEVPVGTSQVTLSRSCLSPFYSSLLYF
jgi:hypothetical protein